MKQPQNRNISSREWRTTALSAAVLFGLTAISSAAHSATDGKKIGDLEIYQAAEGVPTLMMMLDLSSSMDTASIERDYGESCKKYSQIDSEKITATVLNDDGSINTEVVFAPKGCEIDGVPRFTRLNRLKKAMVELFADEVYRFDTDGTSTKDESKGSLPDNYRIGVGYFSSAGYEGVIAVAVDELTAAQRAKIVTTISNFEFVGGTPTPQAIAEAGAYMMGTTTFDGTNDRYSGFSKSTADAKSEAGDRYKSPLVDSQCSGDGIYLLTDGEPYRSSREIAQRVMNTSLQDTSLSVEQCDALEDTRDVAPWGCIGEYAKLLRDPASNSLNRPIKTATVGFGRTFDGLTGTKTVTINGKQREVVDCESGNTIPDARNLCRLGEIDRQDSNGNDTTLGGGGFYYTQESADIASSITDFAANLVQMINTAPSGTITIPNDPYRAANQLSYAYLPMLDPDVASTASIWQGNLKKYHLDQGTLFGNSDERLYDNAAGNLRPTTQDVWQTADFTGENAATANNNIRAGGVYAQLRTPTSGRENVRKIYVEDYTSSSNRQPTLRELSVSSAGKPVGFDRLVDTATYTTQNQLRLLNFLGFDTADHDGAEISLVTMSERASPDIDMSDLTLSQPTREIKVLGGVLHSTPAAISYGAELDENGRITDDREDYVLFGSMDGALHLVDSDDGKEAVAVVPRSMMINQPEALVSNSTKGAIGQPYFGVDAPWLVTTDYKYDLGNPQDGDNGKVTVDTAGDNGMFAYGGLRMGGEAFYGIDITSESSPEVLFTITPEGLNYTASNDFERLGQIWSKPTEAQIRLSENDDDPTDVLIFGGGYDMGYEDEDYVPTVANPAKGNAIYMINAHTGELIWSTSSAAAAGKNVKTDEMIHSITGEIAVLDRDNDGLTDHIYAADLGGQVFRIDLQNARSDDFGFTAVSSFSAKPAVRILNTKPSGTFGADNSKYAYRFYDRPIVSFYRREGGSDNGRLFALVNVVSGNRSAPLSKLREDNAFANRVYGIIDSDVTRSDLYTTSTYDVEDVTDTDLVNLADTLGNTPTEDAKNAAKAGMIAGTQDGWYYPLTRFNGEADVKYNKSMGDSAVINSLLYTTVYNPDYQYGSTDSCAAKIRGASERQLYCLPYGVCMEDTSITGTGGFVPAGQGIQELALGAFNADNTNLRVLIGTTTLEDRIDAGNRVDFSAGGDGSATEYIFNERYTLQPRVWYERDQ